MLEGDVPVGIGALSNLTCLSLASNNFNGVLSEEHFTSLVNLESLEISPNSLKLDFGEDWVPPFRLIEGYFGSCDMGPRFPTWLRWQIGIQYLDISNASIIDILPHWFWTAFPNASWLDLSRNQLSGGLPTKLELPLLIQNMDLSRNSLSGQLPANLTAPHLGSLDLYNNHFTGTIPPYVCDGFWEINLSNNQLTGVFPQCQEKTASSSLSMLDLRNNNISGEFPRFLQNATQLSFLDLSYNKFSGIVPIWIAEKMPNLEVLILRSNMFHGHLPKQLTSLIGLHYLDIAHNNLSGSIPSSLARLSAMVEPYGGNYQDFNYSSDSISTFIKGQELNFTHEFIKDTVLIDLSSNGFTGHIPKELSSLKGLRSLNLSNNQISESISDDIGSLKRLESLDLSCNHFTGKIPSSLSDLTFLSRLNLSYNDLSGTIPSGQQLQTINNQYMYIGNPGLCGPPLVNNCSMNETNPNINQQHEDARSSLYLSMGMGFVMGVWTVFCIMLFLKTWRTAYFQLLDQLYNKSSTRCVPRERDALLALRASLTDPGNYLSSWQGEECCQWEGVRCSNHTGHVTELQLQNLHGFHGGHSGAAVPDFIGGLNNLRYLYLSDANFGGRVPPQLGNLSKLLYLDLNNLFWNYSSYIYSTDLAWLSRLTTLQYLDLSFVKLSTVIDWAHVVNKLPSLVTLNLLGCGLQNSIPLPVNYVNLKSLEQLDLSGNEFSSSLGPNNLFWYLPNLLELDMGGCGIQGSIPERIGNMTSLTRLYLDVNNLTGTIPTTFKNLHNLEVLWLFENKIDGPVAVLLERLLPSRNRLGDLDLSKNELTGSMPYRLGHLRNLTHLRLDNNFLSGELPTSISTLSKLTELSLGFNNLHGTVTEIHFAEMASLRMLDLIGNSLSMVFRHGWFPPFKLHEAELQSYFLSEDSISALDISNTSIAGPIPHWFWVTFSGAKILVLSRNKIRGMLPPTMFWKMGAVTIDFSDNCLVGSIPKLPLHIEEGDFFVKFKIRCKDFISNLVLVYGPAQEDQKQRFLTELAHLLSKETVPMVIGGDFNIMRGPQEKSKGNFKNRWPFLFNAVIDVYNLRELELSRRQFTWANNLMHQILKNWIGFWSQQSGNPNTPRPRLNFGNIILIPKVDDASKIQQYRPICFLNVSFKIFTKVASNRIVKVAHKIIRPSQTAFLPGRNIMEGAVVLHETLHELHRKNLNGVIFKIDFEKAYDKVRWDFLQQTMHMKGFSTTWFNWIKSFVQGGNVAINVNGQNDAYFQTKKGLRQEDPLSPIIFNIVADMLAIIINRAKVVGKVNGVIPHLVEDGLSILQYADDTVIFLDHDLEKARNMKALPCMFEKLSSLKINFHKSEIFCFGQAKECENDYSELFGCRSGSFPFRYLGLPMHYRKLRNSDRKHIEEMFEKRLSGWKEKLLSVGGRLVLINSVLSSLPMFMLSFFAIPKGVLKKLEYFRSRFFWQNDQHKKKYHLIKWHQIRQPKEQGGLGIIDLEVQNKCLLSKWLFKLANEDGIWQNLIRNKYLKSKPLGSGIKKPGVSHFWAGLMEVKKVFLGLGSFHIGDGTQVRFWEDTWCGNQPLKLSYPSLFSIARKKGAIVADVMSSSPLNMSFRRDLHGRGYMPGMSW
ncbi:hypothetical protein U9M48_018567 [Paspalum notatum var. saurae]|uniref:Reverse transcriptase domain-containing protein n=1 Tax=Paspalum notatum var. saurae TaxID=547442 RepID=A0AAQ3TB66_PASNO